MTIGVSLACVPKPTLIPCASIHTDKGLPLISKPFPVCPYSFFRNSTICSAFLPSVYFAKIRFLLCCFPPPLLKMVSSSFCGKEKAAGMVYFILASAAATVPTCSSKEGNRLSCVKVCSAASPRRRSSVSVTGCIPARSIPLPRLCSECCSSSLPRASDRLP